MKNIHSLWLLVVLFFLFACGHEQPKSAKKAPEEPQKKEVAAFKPEKLTVTFEELKQKIDKTGKELRIFVFDESGCEACQDIFDNLQKIQSEGMDFVLNKVITGDKNGEIDNSIGDFNVYRLERTDNLEKIIPEWNNKLPFIVIANEETATNLSYQQTFSKDELFVLLQSLTL